MAKYFVTRHRGAIDWARSHGIDARIVAHLDLDTVNAGDTVMGVLPVGMIAAINARGARFFALCIDVPQGSRGGELTADEMRWLDAKLVEYEARELGTWAEGDEIRG